MTAESTTMSASRRGAITGAVLLALGLGLDDGALARSPAQHQRPQAAEKLAQKAQAPDPLQQGKQERVPFTAQETASAKPEDLPSSVRFAGDDPAAFQKVVGDARAAHDSWLVISGGGENGAFAAGILSGWSRAGNRPNFGVITGVSTGALIAPFAFVGPSADAALKQNYTEITAADVFEFGGTNAALTDTWPLKDRIDKSVTPDLLKAIAAEHAKGRRLLVATTQVETERPVVWDMGAIASLASGPEAQKYGDRPLKLFREIVLASTAVPGVFPPVMIDAVTEGGKRIQEMHDDGGSMAPYYLAPAATLAGAPDGGMKLPASTVYLVINNKLTPEFGLVPRTVLGVLSGTVSAAIKAQTQGALAITRAYAARTHLDLRVAEIDGRFDKVSPGPFDPKYMKALFEHGEALAKSGKAFPEAQIASPRGRSDNLKGADAVPMDDRTLAQR
ncbi:putative acylesterase/phospholipase RssA [Methylobacterium brachythecii]|nr:patatin-like phospholipase family protein [Methylobacterium brachythecii]MBB3902893.1 putative acylesterase/phospholipase RssA [Methylobacterium brachythecii]